MQDIFERFYAYFWGVWRYRWYALALAWLVCLVTWPMIMKLPDRYRASAQVFVDTDLVLPEVVGVGPLTNPQARLNAMSRTLLTRPNLEEIVRKTDLDLKINNPAEQRALLNELREGITITSGRRNDLYTLAYTNEDPQLAKNVVQAALSLFVERTLRESGESVTKVENFLDREVAEKETEVRDLENQLTDFKRENVDLLPATGQSYREYVARLETEIAAATLELQQAERKRDLLSREIEGEVPSFGIGSDLAALSADEVTGLLSGAEPSFDSFKSTINSLPEQQRLYKLEEQLDVLLVQYTDEHPDVVTLRQLIPQLRAEVDRKLAALYEENKVRRSLQNAQVASQLSQTSDGFFYQLRLQNLDVQADIDALKIQIENKQNRLDTIREKRDLLPQIEAELRRFENDLRLANAELDDMRERQKRVQLGIKVGESEDIRFDIVEPPFVPSTPAAPHRSVLFAGALAVALAIGLALAFVIAQLRPTFDTRRALMVAFQAPVIGSVSGFWPPEQLRRQRLQLFAYWSLGFTLVGLCVGLVWLDRKGVNLLSFV